MENDHLEWENPLKMVIFHCYVSSPEGIGNVIIPTVTHSMIFPTRIEVTGAGRCNGTYQWFDRFNKRSCYKSPSGCIIYYNQQDPLGGPGWEWWQIPDPWCHWKLASPFRWAGPRTRMREGFWVFDSFWKRRNVSSMDWIKRKFTGNHRFSH